jgi:aspartate/methionine/tyrosine aminotransferase
MTGWRLGYATAPARIVPALDMRWRSTPTPAPPNSASMAPLKLCATGRRHAAHGWRVCQTPRAVVRDRIAFPIPLLAARGAFYAWVDLEAGQSAEICRIMLEEAG